MLRICFRPDFGPRKPGSNDVAVNFAFTRTMGADELRFSFAYRVQGIVDASALSCLSWCTNPACIASLAEDEHGNWLSKRVMPSSFLEHMDYRERLRSSRHNPIGPSAASIHPVSHRQGEETVLPDDTPTPEARLLEQVSRMRERNDGYGSSRRLLHAPSEDLEALKRRWRYGEDDEHMYMEAFKRAKLEGEGGKFVPSSDLRRLNIA